MRTPINQSRHDAVVKNIAARLVASGWSVQADVSGYFKPLLINGYIPDIYAVRNGKPFIIEVETQDSVNIEHAMAQKVAFQTRANLVGGGFEIRIA